VLGVRRHHADTGAPSTGLGGAGAVGPGAEPAFWGTVCLDLQYAAITCRDDGHRFRPISPRSSSRTAEEAVTQGDRRPVGGECRQGQQGLRVRPLERLIDGSIESLGRGAAGKAANLGGCKSLYRQLPETDG
jgi:hypothetical protein